MKDTWLGFNFRHLFNLKAQCIAQHTKGDQYMYTKQVKESPENYKLLTFFCLFKKKKKNAMQGW